VLAADSPEVLERFHSQLELVRIVAGQVARALGAHVEFDDLMSGGREGLLDAARRYDPERGVPFRMYANYRVRGAMLDSVRRMSALSRRSYERLAAFAASSEVSEGGAEPALARARTLASPGAAEAAVVDHVAAMATAAALSVLSRQTHGSTSDQTAELASDSDPEQDFERAELLALLRTSIAELPPDESELMKLYYFEERPPGEAAASLDMSSSWARRLHMRAVARLTKRLRDRA
jgi:RNA polymerase sigma factor FliA